LEKSSASSLCLKLLLNFWREACFASRFRSIFGEKLALPHAFAQFLEENSLSLTLWLNFCLKSQSAAQSLTHFLAGAFLGWSVSWLKHFLPAAEKAAEKAVLRT
jgi:hypothetical protein